MSLESRFAQGRCGVWWRSVLRACASLMVVGLSCHCALAANAQWHEPPAAVEDQTYLGNCAGCHGDTLGGTFGPSLKGAAFRAKWGARASGALRDYIARSMPPANPGGLSVQDYDRLTVLIQRTNNMPSVEPEVSRESRATEHRVLAPDSANQSDGLTSTTENRDAQYGAAMAKRDRVLAGLMPVGRSYTASARARRLAELAADR